MCSDAWSVPGFTEVAELGRGSSGTVIQATDSSGAPVAIKYLSAELVADEGFRSAFRDEARLLAGIDTPHVARLVEYVESSYGAAIIMELVAGASLRATLAAHGPTEPTSALSVLKGSLLGLRAAHRAGVVHRDYKPENVMLTSGGDSKLVDFGVALRAGGIGDGAGTPAYMSPEQWLPGGSASPRGDIYSATATFVECVTGRPPYVANDITALRQLHEHAPIPDALLPEPLRDLARRGLAKDPAARPADAGAFLRELETAAAAGYGDNWEEEGRGDLARRVGLLLLLQPASAASAAGTSIAETTLPDRKGPSSKLLVGSAAGLLVAAGIAAILLWPTDAPQPRPTSGEVVALEPAGSPPSTGTASAPPVQPVKPPAQPIALPVAPVAPAAPPADPVVSTKSSSGEDSDDDDDDDGGRNPHPHGPHKPHGGGGGTSTPPPPPPPDGGGGESSAPPPPPPPTDGDGDGNNHPALRKNSVAEGSGTGSVGKNSGKSTGKNNGDKNSEKSSGKSTGDKDSGDKNSKKRDGDKSSEKENIGGKDGGRHHTS
ncbi:MAG TPA: serine/threonine-protein kinase [Pseudonocardia sp.]|nr:serine/threonine-protein kinase [Pseudonocardia sp.]